MSRFVILEHDHPEPHFDFMLEHGGVLWTWRLAEFPAPGVRIVAEALPDHRLAYLEYEGPVGGNRGQVVRRDQGTFATAEGDLTRAGPLVLTLHGERVRGIVVMEPLHPDAWLFQLREA